MRTRAWALLVCFTLAGCSAVSSRSTPWPDTHAKIYLAPETAVWTNAWDADRYRCQSSTGQKKLTYSI
jgi:uncharacterized protein YceK